MNTASTRWAIIFAVVAVLATLEQILFGRDTPGAAHDVSVSAWALSLIAAAALVGIGIVRLAKFVTARRR